MAQATKTKVRIVLEHLCEVEADRPKRIDQYIDYFGRIGARRTVVTSATCAGSLVEADGAH
jgi:hypothetical protein